MGRTASLGRSGKSLLDDPKTLRRVQTNHRKNKEQDHTSLLDAASAVIRENRNRQDKRLWTDRKGGDRIVYFRGGDELEEADFITRTARSALAEDVEAVTAALPKIVEKVRSLSTVLHR